MFSYCLKRRKNTGSKELKIVKTKNRLIMLFSNYTAFNSKKSRLTKEQEASGLLSSLGIKTPLSKIPLLDHLLF